MSLRDRFFTPKTAKAILSWRILAGVAIGVGAWLVGAPALPAAVVGAIAYGGSVLAAMPKGVARPQIDPFALSEPWRQLMQGAQGAGRRLRQTVDATADGPLKSRLGTIADDLERGLAEAWEVARRGDEIDDAVRRLDPTALRSKLATLEQQAGSDPSPDLAAAIGSVRGQLEAADRLKAQSAETAGRLRLVQTRLDELVARASEVRIGAVDTDRYAHDVDDLVVQLEALRQAVEETRER